MNNKLYKDDQGNLVEVFSMTPTEVKFSNQGGGFLMRCSRQEFDSKFTPAAEPEYSCMVVTAEWLDQNLPEVVRELVEREIERISGRAL